MTLIEGVGDEVTNFFIIVGVLLVIWIAWCSTNIVDQPLIRTVLILQHRTRIRIAELRANHQTNGSHTLPSNIELTEESTETNLTDNNETETSCPQPSTMGSSASTEDTNPEDVLIEAMDSFDNHDSNILPNQTKIDSESSESTEQISPPPEDLTNDHLTADEADNISIKLKFINDDQKLVCGSLKEMLGSFKRRHFQIELESQKIVRLVFKGQVLRPDSRTLEQCGLYNNCVVHCLVHQPRPVSATNSQTNTLDNSSSLYFNPQSFQDLPAGTGLSSVHNEWDLSRLLVSALTLILGLAWYSRYHYAQLFTATTTLALYALTAIFTISLFSNFFPDQESIRNMD